MIVVPKPDYIQFLLERRFSELRQPPSRLSLKYGFTDGVVYGDDEIGGFPEPPEAVLQAAESYRQELLKLSPAEVKARYDAELEQKHTEDDQRRFFNEPKAAADFEHWGRMDLWNLDEAASLSFGKDPRVVSRKRVEAILSYTSPFASKYRDLCEVIERAVQAKSLSFPIKPEIFVAWTERNGILFPENLKAIVKARGQETPDWKARYGDLSEKTTKMIAEQESRIADLTQELEKALAEKPLKTRERDTVCKIIIGMAVRGYAYNPQAKKNTAISDIASDIQHLGLSVDQDTIRRWVQEALLLIPPEALEKRD